MSDVSPVNGRPHTHSCRQVCGYSVSQFQDPCGCSRRKGSSDCSCSLPGWWVTGNNNEQTHRCMSANTLPCHFRARNLHYNLFSTHAFGVIRPAVRRTCVHRCVCTEPTREHLPRFDSGHEDVPTSISFFPTYSSIQSKNDTRWLASAVMPQHGQCDKVAFKCVVQRSMGTSSLQ